MGTLTSGTLQFRLLAYSAAKRMTEAFDRASVHPPDSVFAVLMRDGGCGGMAIVNLVTAPAG